MTTTRLFLVRHALVEPSARLTMYGAMDVGLCELALRQEAATYRWLAARLPQPARWAVTPLSRTRATAAAIFAAGYPEAELETHPQLIEQRLGEWEGLPHEAFLEQLRHPPHPFWSISVEERPPGGESFADVIARVGPAVDRLVAENEGGDVVIVAHGGSIRAALAHAMGAPGLAVLSFSIKNLSLTRLEKVGPDWRVAAVNEEMFTL
ncbi:histidine phosphatase family protein [Falsiroseomonas bella]|uniref:Histidine phosphatase family protein n=1 Tax=Falsiroseomonas bella TaxID=2184016 RepID=A0A317F9S2_9PROT|nr:histidine phosphatase family protein [Falsiroseomonas bella]PWS35515.1 histidine phosphatase family protein [Falsiroseomonas bella]